MLQLSLLLGGTAAEDDSENLENKNMEELISSESILNCVNLKKKKKSC